MGKAVLPKLILIFLSVDWPIFSRRPMVTALAKAVEKLGTNVIAINRPLCPFSTALRKPRRLSEFLARPKLTRLEENLYLYSPKYFLHDHFSRKGNIVERLNIVALRRSIDSVQKRIGVFESSPIVWYYHPQQAYVSRIYGRSFNIFELYDNLTSVDGNYNPAVLNREKEWKAEVDLFLATSPKLLQTYGAGYKKSRFVKNGLAERDYHQLSARKHSDSGTLGQIKHPRLGFAGVISERLDWKTILGVADARPDWNLVFAGRVTADKYSSLMSSRSNIHYLGEFSQEQIWTIVAEFDLGIMPYVDNEFFRFSNPLKFYETCAAGIPSVSSPMEILNSFPVEVVRICEGGVEDWTEAISSMLNGTNPETANLCKKIASQHTWESICTDLVSELEAILSSPSNNVS